MSDATVVGERDAATNTLDEKCAACGDPITGNGPESFMDEGYLHCHDCASRLCPDCGWFVARKCTECGCPVIDDNDESYRHKENGCLYCYDCMEKLFACCRGCEDYRFKVDMSSHDEKYYCLECTS